MQRKSDDEVNQICLNVVFFLEEIVSFLDILVFNASFSAVTEFFNLYQICVKSL